MTNNVIEKVDFIPKKKPSPLKWRLGSLQSDFSDVKSIAHILREGTTSPSSK